jgi:CheY-like chemotaxis protein
MTVRKAVVFEDNDLYLLLLGKLFKANDIQFRSYSNPSLYLCCQPEINTCPVAEPCTDFLLTDNVMPYMNGLEFLKRTKQMNCKIPDCRKAIISASWTAEELAEANMLVSNVFAKNEAKEKISAWLGGDKISSPLKVKG